MILADFYRYMSVYVYIFLAHPPLCGAIVWKPVALRVPSISEHPSIYIYLSVYSATTSPDPPLLAHVVSLVLSLQLFAFSNVRGQDSDSVSLSLRSGVLCWIALRMGKDKAFCSVVGCKLSVAGFHFFGCQLNGMQRTEVARKSSLEMHLFLRGNCHSKHSLIPLNGCGSWKYFSYFIKTFLLLIVA